MRSLIAAAALLGMYTVSAQAADSVFNYSLKSNSCVVMPLLPVHNAPISIMGVNIPTGHFAVSGVPGEVTLVWYTNYGGQGFDWFEWVGQDFNGNGVGGTNKYGSHIIFLGENDVELQVYSETRLRVCNTSSEQQRGNITMTWGTATPH